VLLVLLLAVSFVAVVIYSQEDLRQRVRQVYAELVKAEEEGADVAEAVYKLNEALQLIREAEETTNQTLKVELLSKAEALIDEVEASIPKLIEEGRIATRNRLIINAATAVSLVVAAILIYIYGPKLIWKTWIRLRKDWIVVVKEQKPEKKRKKRRK
jgi:hypothetical protein